MLVYTLGETRQKNYATNQMNWTAMLHNDGLVHKCHSNWNVYRQEKVITK